MKNGWRVAGLALLLSGCGNTGEDWSPKDADLLFSSNRDGNNDIYCIRAGDTVWTKLTDTPDGENWPVWSPDGKRIAYQKWVDGKIDIWVMDADGANKTQLTDDPDHDYIPSWTPDGKQITFVSWRSEDGDTGRSNHIYIMNADGSDERRWMTTSPGTSAGPAWSPDGSSFVMNMRVGERTEIFSFSRDGEVIRQVTRGDTVAFGSPEFSPDGSSIVYYADNGLTSELIISDAMGKERNRIVTDGQNYYGRWSPDGTWIVFTKAVDGMVPGDLDIMAIDLRHSGSVVRLAGGPGREAEASWRPSQDIMRE